MPELQGKVLKSTGSWYRVELENGEIMDCRIRGRLRLDGLRTTNPIAVGDEVLILDKQDEEGRGVITDYLLRRNYIVRKSTNLSKQMHILAANIDRAYLLVTLKDPETHLVFIDRFLVAAESFRIPTTLLFNKIDLLDDKWNAVLDEWMQLYQSIGYTCVAISATNEENIDFLRDEINECQVIIAGHSGTGKSTLVNALDPQLDLRIGEISSAHHQGQHTTTFAEMHPLQSGGYIIDTPGIRAFGIVALDKEVISHYFPEMRDRIGNCRFHNCQHLDEPNCDIKEAVANGAIPLSRYESYLQLMEGDDNNIHRRKKHV